MEHIYREYSNKVADAVDAGAIPWRLAAMPRNALSKKHYAGVNPILLNIASARHGFTSPWWATYAQWRALGCTVKQPPEVREWGARIVLYKLITRSKMEERRAVRDVVYNWEQTDRAKPPPDLPEQEPPGRVFDAIVTNGHINIEYVLGSTCKYYGAEDKIRMPHQWMFQIGPGGESGFYDAKGHEIFHWAERRVKWDASPEVCELRAEIGTGYLGGMLGVKPLPRNLARHHDRHAAIWARLMRLNPEMLFDVCENVTITLALLLRYAGMETAWQLQAHNVVPNV